VKAALELYAAEATAETELCVECEIHPVAGNELFCAWCRNAAVADPRDSGLKGLIRRVVRA
jgi:hypothetical protein